MSLSPLTFCCFLMPFKAKWIHEKRQIENFSSYVVNLQSRGSGSTSLANRETISANAALTFNGPCNWCNADGFGQYATLAYEVRLGSASCTSLPEPAVMEIRCRDLRAARPLHPTTYCTHSSSGGVVGPVSCFWTSIYLPWKSILACLVRPRSVSSILQLQLRSQLSQWR